jgi:hypothetical protein
MQIGTQRLFLLVLLALTAMVPIYAPSAASADGFGIGNPCHYSLPGAIQAPKAYFTTIPGTPYTPPTDEFTDSENPPIDSFSATANWGDGATSPAAVRTPTGCSGYEAYAPAHTYLAPGTYSFSYTIHDARTGIDHTVGSETFYGGCPVARRSL